MRRRAGVNEAALDWPDGRRRRPSTWSPAARGGDHLDPLDGGGVLLGREHEHEAQLDTLPSTCSTRSTVVSTTPLDPLDGGGFPLDALDQLPRLRARGGA